MGTMIQGTLRSWSTYSAALAALALFSSLAACTIQEAPKRTPLNTTPDDKGTEQPETTTDPLEPETNEDSGAFGKTTSSGGTSGSIIGTKKFCEGGLKAGDLAIVEIMIASKSGSGDSGEWVEIQSTRDCWLHLAGVTVESPRGTAGADVASVEGAVDLAPGATFVVADSDDATKNHGIKGTVLSWDATDVLKNDGDTISVKLGEVQIDSLTYPSLAAATAGVSVAYPAACESTERSDWLKWTASTDTFGGTFKGTPNAPNDDVKCK
jgi:hypothetical protein